MAANPRMLTTDVTVSWDGGTTKVLRGTIVDIPAGSALETAYGASNLVALNGQQLYSTEIEPVRSGSG